MRIVVINNWLKRGIPVLAGGLLVIAVEGIIGNQAYSLFQLLILWLSKSINQNAVPWIVTAILILVCLVEGAYYWTRDNIVHLTLHRLNKLIELDGSLLRGLASWVPANSSVDQTERILKEILRDATVEFDGHVHRAAILAVDATGENLKCLAHYNMPQESIDDMVFYVGSDAQKREHDGGVAGEVFVLKKLCVGHFTPSTNGQWVCDLVNFRKTRVNRPYPTYKSFVNVPITGIDPTTRNTITCFGVLCFDSLNEKIFDSQEIKEVLSQIAERIAATILISRQLP